MESWCKYIGGHSKLKERASGFLLLTNKRIVFESLVGAPFSKRPEVTMDIPLYAVKEMKLLEPGFIRKSVLTIVYVSPKESSKEEPSFLVKDYEGWVNALNKIKLGGISLV